MPRKVVFIVAILLSLSLIITTSAAVAMPTKAVTIFPENCRVRAGEELLLTLDGYIPPDASITWDASSGGITSVLPGQNAIFVAPLYTTVVTVSVSMSSSLPSKEPPITRQCIVTSLNKAPTGVAEASGRFFRN